MVGNWLYGVAHSTALKARAMSIKRLAKEREAAGRPRPEAAETSEHLLALLDEELRALPDKYRVAIVLCDLEGKSIKDAARQLGSPPGTIGTRLARGRSLLARRLARRGLTLSGGVIATVIAEKAALAHVPMPLMSSTIQAARLFAAGQAASAVVGARAAALIEEALRTMFLTRLKITAAVLVLLLAVIGLGARLLAWQEPDRSASPAEPGAKEAKEDKDGDRLDRHWEGVSAEVDGVRCRSAREPGVPPPPYWELTKDAGCFNAQKVRPENCPNEVAFRFKYKLDAAAQPKAIDLIPEEGPARGKTLRGIYSLERNELKICYVSPNTPEPQKKPRPGEFAARKDSGYVLLVFRDFDGIGRDWEAVAAEVDGAKVPPPGVWGFGRGGGGIGIREDRPKDSPNEVVFFFQFTLDPAAQPKAIDLIPKEGPARGKTLRGIYSLEGDMLKICYVSPNTPEPQKKPRPSEFAARKGSGHVLLVFRQDVINEAALDKAGFDKTELEYARGVLAAWRAAGLPAGTREFKEQLWPKEFGKWERLRVIESLAEDLAKHWALPATLLHPVEARLAGKPAPPLEGMTWYNTGQPLAWKDLNGKVVVLDCMAESCVPCVAALPKLKALHEQFGDKGLVVICVLANKNKEAAKTVPEFVKKHEIAFPVMVDAEAGKTFKSYHIEAYGTYLVVDKTGKVVPRGGRFPRSAPTAEEIKELLDQ
jgi:uncharacterized protein (TIGR03067 family)